MHKEFERTLVTAALPYANGPLHIGHIAGCYLPADIYVRFLRLKGEDVVFICGSDEHGVPITLQAKKEGVSPRQIVDRYHELMKQTFRDFGIHFDIYSRTTHPGHYQTASEFFKVLNDKGIFQIIETEQYYDEEACQFLADRYIAGECPKCGNPDAYGDQCEKCGTSLSPMELKNPRSLLSGKPPVLRKTKNWYLPLNLFQKDIEQYINTRKNWKPNVMGQCKSWLEMGDGLQPRAMTRDLEWGVPVPLEEAKGKVLYVWFDAPIGYISATKELMPERWKTYWQDKKTRLIHFIGKDNIVFHCIIFPAMLMAHGNFILPDNVPANEFLNLEGQKISTSRRWAVWVHEYLEDFPGMQDSLRYALCTNMPETKDNDFTWKEFQLRHNSELVAILGNFVHRTLVLTHKFFNGQVPNPSSFIKEDLHALSECKAAIREMAGCIEEFHFRDAIQKMMQVARIGNKYLADMEPWKLGDTQEERKKAILYTSVQITAMLSVVCEPFLPFTSEKLKNMLACHHLGWNNLEHDHLIPPGHKFGKPEILFRKIEDLEVENQIKKLNEVKNKSTTSEPEEKPVNEISYDDFSRLRLIVATIEQAEKVAGADKLLRLTLNDGKEKRTVVSGIALHYTPEEIIGKQVLLLANLAPKKLRGIESKGMILMAENSDGKLIFVAPETKTQNGAPVK
ncbi:MAG: methionine--tRNA ligase [Bacteroidia bacterium]|nr:methionine--tRNA ligase [Bacteroidia bacterium]